jgi:mRNA interferase RelE/StbE
MNRGKSPGKRSRQGLASDAAKTYAVVLKPGAVRVLERLPKKDQRIVGKRIDSLKTDPRKKGEKLKGQDSLYRIRAGNLRIIYEVHDNVCRVLVVTIGDRKDVYRRLP